MNKQRKYLLIIRLRYIKTMPHISTSSLQKFFLSLVIGSFFGFLFTGFIVWGQFVEPVGNPPGGTSIATPLTTASVPQTKGGPLILNFTSSGGDTGLKVRGYLQLDNIDPALPPGDTPGPGDEHCDEDDERGRMILEPITDTGTQSLWICSGAAGSAAWVEKSI